MQPSNLKEPGRYSLPELTKITLTRPADQLTTTEHLVIAQLLEEFKRIQRQETP